MNHPLLIKKEKEKENINSGRSMPTQQRCTLDEYHTDLAV
jgi:hypothetical protein